ncbi:MAG: glutamate--tRNA ligase, partial [Pseudomonadota bacterium]
VNFLFAKSRQGNFILRLDDTDTERSRPEYASAIEEDMLWLGLKWDDFQKQSDKFANYEIAKQKLIAQDRLYACYETPDELDMQRKLQAGRGRPPIYDRGSLNLSPEQKQKYEREGRKPHYRFLLEAKPIIWQDMIRGEAKFYGTNISDPVLIREDGVTLYTLASVVDDGDMNITHVLRGEDHVTNTAVQIQIFEALGITPPEFGHLALLKTKEGELSKRVGGNDIRGLRDAGIEAMAVNSLLSKIGTSDATEPFNNMEELIKSFDIKKFGRAPANYDSSELERLNEKLLHQLSFEEIKEKLGFGNEKFWLAIRANLKILSDAKKWWDIIEGEISKPELDKEYINAVIELLPKPEWNETTWGAWTKSIAEKTGKKGKDLFMPLRLALTGEEHGPEMKLFLPLIGYEKTLKRLQN